MLNLSPAVCYVQNEDFPTLDRFGVGGYVQIMQATAKVLQIHRQNQRII